MSGVEIASNRFVDVDGAPIYIDTGSSFNGVIRDNYFEQVATGILHWPSSPTSPPVVAQNRVIENNEFVLKPTIQQDSTYLASAITLQSGASPPNLQTYKNLIVRGTESAVTWARRATVGR